MLSRLVSRLSNHFTIRLKGPAAQRLKRDEGLKVEDKRIQNFFSDYSPETAAFYRNGFSPAQLQNSSESVKRAFSLQNATPRQILQYRIEQAIKKYQRNLLDHGNAAIQCAIFSERIILMMSHVSNYPKDFRAGRNLTQLIQKRRRMLNYCMRTDYHRYKWVCNDYGIPDVHPINSTHKTQWNKFYNNYRRYY